MVQGQTKGLAKAKNTGARHAQKAAAAPKKGKRYIAPKKAALVKQAALHKVSSISCLSEAAASSIGRGGARGIAIGIGME